MHDAGPAHYRSLGRRASGGAHNAMAMRLSWRSGPENLMNDPRSRATIVRGDWMLRCSVFAEGDPAVVARGHEAIAVRRRESSRCD
jgi:hypothetical protein